MTTTTTTNSIARSNLTANLNASDQAEQAAAGIAPGKLRELLRRLTATTVEEGIDVAIRISPVVKDGGLVARKLAVDRTVMCASPEYLARKGTPERPEDLVHHDCLIYSLLKVGDEWRFRGRRPGETATVPVEGRFRAGSGAVLMRAALAGMGIAVLPAFMIASELATGKLLRVIDSFVGVNLSIFAVYPHVPQSSRPPSKVRAFVDLLVAAFREPPWRDQRESHRNRAAARRK